MSEKKVNIEINVELDEEINHIKNNYTKYINSHLFIKDLSHLVEKSGHWANRDFSEYREAA